MWGLTALSPQVVRGTRRDKTWGKEMLVLKENAIFGDKAVVLIPRAVMGSSFGNNDFSSWIACQLNTGT